MNSSNLQSDGNSRVKIEPLTSIRFVAAFSVMLSHFGSSLNTVTSPLVMRLVKSGSDSVLLFFVLSGFIMGHVYYNKDLSTLHGKRKYYLARISRIVPLYYLALLLGLLNLLTKGTSGVSVSHLLASIIAKFMFIHCYFPSLVVNPNWALATWTLSVEFGFYLLFPFVAKWVLNSKDNKLGWQLGAALGLCAVLSPITYALTHEGYSNLISYFNGFMYPGFFWLGMLSERLRRNYSQLLARMWLSMLSLGVGLYFIARLADPHPAVGLMIRGLGSALIVLGLFYATGAIRAVFSLPIFVVLGEASYALYLLHGPCHSTMDLLLRKFNLPLIAESPFILVTYLLATILVSVFALNFIENPARRWILNRFSTAST